MRLSNCFSVSTGRTGGPAEARVDRNSGCFFLTQHRRDASYATQSHCVDTRNDDKIAVLNSSFRLPLTSPTRRWPPSTLLGTPVSHVVRLLVVESFGPKNNATKMHPRANQIDTGRPIRASPPIQIEAKPSHAQPRKYISFYAQSILIWSLATCCERHGCADRPEESGQRVLSPPTHSHQVMHKTARSVADDSYGSKVCCPTARLQGDSLSGGPGDSATSTHLCGVPP